MRKTVKRFAHREPEIDAIDLVVPPVDSDEDPSSEDLEEIELEEKNSEPLTSEPGASAYSLYLREIGQTRLLTPREEIVLAKRIAKGDAHARDQMIQANLRLVVKIAREFEDFGVPLLDLINEGNIGLMKAVERFDPAKGAKLSTYAAWWIKQSIRRALSNQSKTIRLPVHVGEKLLHMRRASVKLQEVFGREPTDEELADELGMSRARVTAYRSAAIRPASLDAPVGDDDTKRLGEIVQDERMDTPYQDLEDKTNTALLHELLRTLPERESRILRQRFGLEGDSEKTLEEIGAEFGVTRERIRQIQNIALQKLRKMIEHREAVRMAA